MAVSSVADGHVTGAVRLVLRLEGLALLVLGTGLYFVSGGPWWLLVILFLAPDIAFLGYLAGTRIGAAAYNVMHSLIGPLALGGIGFYVTTTPLLLQIALIWLAHVGFDRALGFGLKYESSFSDTHLGRIGRGAAQ
jgi:hypothetical protein